MSDPQAHAGEPVEEPASDVEDVVGSAQAGLAAAAAAGAADAGASDAADEASAGAGDKTSAAEDPGSGRSGVGTDAATAGVGVRHAPEPRLPDITIDEPFTGAGTAPAVAPGAEQARADAASGPVGPTGSAPAGGAPDEAASHDALRNDTLRNDAAGNDPLRDDDSDDGAVFSTPALNEAYRAEAARGAATPDSDARESTVAPAAWTPPAEPLSAAPSPTASSTGPVTPDASATAPDAPTAAPALPVTADPPTTVDPLSQQVAGADGAVASGFTTQPTQAEPTRQQPQPIFVTAPEEPRPRGNRGASGAIGLVAAVAFAALYLGADLLIAVVERTVTLDGAGPWLLAQLSTWGVWVPTAVFFIAFWLLGAIVNRGRWGIWVIVGLLVGVAAWGGHLLGQLFEAPFWMVSAAEGAHIVDTQLFAPLAVAAFLIGRELTVWFSAWAAAHGRRVAEQNIEARREYERTIEAGPQGGR